MIKLHVVAFQQGVKKIFWYNYKDHESEREYAENYFGLVDYNGYPKPVYLAYIHLYSLLKGKQAVGMRTIGEDIQVYTFESQKERTSVIWTRSGKNRKLSVKAFDVDHEISKITDAIGKPEAPLDGFVEVSEMPIFFTSRK